MRSDSSRQIARSRFGRFLQTVERNGLLKAVGDSALSVANRFAYERILKGVTIDAVNPAFLTCDERYQGSFIPAGALRSFAADPATELDHAFLDRAFSRGDECYGFVVGNQLASYGWYSNKPTETEAPELAVYFDPTYMYMYKGYTHPDHRGKRLHAIGMTRALDAYMKRGFKGFVSYVEWNNFDSLRSCYRMGYKDFGTVYVMKLFGRFYAHSSAGCRQYKFRVDRAPDV